MAQLELLDRQQEHWSLLRKPQGGVGRSLAIFVHGFLGDHITTWGRLPEMLNEHAPNEASLADWDFLFMGYATREMLSYLDIAHLIATQWERAAAGRPPFGGGYKRLALFGHSLGTLGIRQLLCAGVLHPKGMLEALHSVTLFGTPLNGSPLADYSLAELRGGPIAESLKPGNPQLRMLRIWNQSLQPLLHWKDVRIVLGADDWVVGSKYADLIDFAGDSKPSVLNFDHKHLVKPQTWESSAIRDEIVAALQ